ncbi:MAG: thiosulfate oxidation carrier complex protein SoxZ, partial [Alphaproteobacteria bacterium]|nr:thiosulfate oxidation carrier complex protein SoxZ [Alphaproteobacteria bacterium]
GLRRDEGGRPVPRNMLRSFEARANNEPVFGASFANGTATNPAPGFHLRIERSVALSFVRPRGDDTTFRRRRRVQPGRSPSTLHQHADADADHCRRCISDYCRQCGCLANA